MLFVTIEDTDAAMEILVFPKVLDATDAIWEEDKVVLVSGKISDKDGNFKILCDTVTVINQAEVEKFSRVLATRQHNEKLAEKKNDYSKMIITLPSSTSQDILKKLSQYFDRCEAGAIKVFLSINNSRLETAYCIAHSDTLENNLKNIVPEAKVEIY